MGKVEKKRKKLEERIDYLEKELIEALTKKTSTTKEINVADQQIKIRDLKLELAKLS